jgi:lipoprotein-releasing system ATP-binding protein
MAELTVHHLTRTYPTRGEPLAVLRDATFRLQAGDSLAVLGPSGSGKSTLLHILGTLDIPTSGTLQLDGQNPFALDEVKLAEFRNRMIGFVFQEHHLLPQLSVLENTLVPLVARGTTTSQDAEWAKQLLDRVGLAQRLDHRPAELSGGERQRVAIARALVTRPRLVLADEPTGNLDRHTAQSIGQLLVETVSQQEHPAILVAVTHSRELADIFQQRAELLDGRLCLDGQKVE